MKVESWLAGGSLQEHWGKLDTAASTLRTGEHPIPPFHWEIEFPEVFERENRGFDAIVGNPPFLGGKRISTTLGDSYRDWLALTHAASTSNADLVAHFFRRVFNLLRTGGAFGLIATNTIAQGDTRASGLGWICQHGGEIFAARKRLRWPGLAAVVVSVLHVVKGAFLGQKQLDRREVDIITAFLFHRGGHNDPAALAAYNSKIFVGNYVLGMGFTFDDADTKGVATSLAEMRQLINQNSYNREVIFPYIGGEEINTSPTQKHHRYVINFGARSEEECRRRWPDLMAIVETKVRPERMKAKRKALRERWWQFAEKQPALRRAIAGLQRRLVVSRVTEHRAFVFVPADVVCSERLVVIAQASYSSFAALQSRVVDLWSDFVGTTHEERRMFSSKSFGTFAFPESWETHPDLEITGKAYYEFRASVMVKNDEGLTKTYNRFHARGENVPDIARLRGLHAEMDAAVLRAYGWIDLADRAAAEFIEQDTDEGKAPKTRFDWPAEFKDEVLARLLALNAERAAAERAAGLIALTEDEDQGEADDIDEAAVA